MSKDAATCVQASPQLAFGGDHLARPARQEKSFPCPIYLSDPLRFGRLSLAPGSSLGHLFRAHTPLFPQPHVQKYNQASIG